MVCQAAGQTRFRALKHESGIIVRIIACFQPLQDCQAEYFRQLLKPDSAWKYTNLNRGQWSPNSIVYPGFAVSKFLPHLNQKKFMVFDHSGDHMNIFFSSDTELSLMTPREEIHEEDSDEIDALLYSESDDDPVDEEASSGHSPLDATTGLVSTEEEEKLAMAGKRKRVDDSVIDTASSAESGCGGQERGEEGESASGGSKRVKREERIHETVGVLRRIIPGGKGKDAATVIDVAIRYLRGLKLQARGLGVGSIL